MAEKYVIVQREIPPEIKPEYTNLEDAAAALLAIRATSPRPDAIVLVKLSEGDGVIVRTELTVFVEDSPKLATTGVTEILP